MKFQLITNIGKRSLCFINGRSLPLIYTKTSKISLQATERYKRISDHACKLTGEQRRREALNIVQRKALLDNARTLKTATSKETPEKLKTYKDKTLSMRYTM